MKVLVISDIHANKEALYSILEEEKEWDLLVCAGDIVDYGTSPVEIIDFFLKNKSNTVLVKGNHDDHLIRTFYDGAWKILSGESYKWIHYNCEKLKLNHIVFLNNLKNVQFFCVDNYCYLLKHQYDDEYGQIENEKQFIDFWKLYAPKDSWNFAKKRIIFGHSHVQNFRKINDNMECLNPGSISYRRPGNTEKRAEYILIINGDYSFKLVPYNRTHQLNIAKMFESKKAMKTSEINDFYMFFGDRKFYKEEV